MSNDAILIPGEEENFEYSQQTPQEEYLTVSGSLKEIADAGNRAVARGNLRVYSKQEVNTLIDDLRGTVNTNNEKTKDSFDEIQQRLDNIEITHQNEFIKKDGSNDFEAVQNGVTPGPSAKETALVTIKYVLDKLNSNSSQTKQYIDEELKALENYALLGDVYDKKNTYSQSQIKNLLRDYVKNDGSTGFKSPQEGQYPKFRTHLSTKGYVDDVLNQHKNDELNPHNIQTILNSKLSNYYQKSETYTKAQTYSRLQIDSIIDKLVSDACKGIIEKHLNTTQHLSSQDIQQILRLYAAANLITKSDLEDELTKIDEKIDNNKPVWITSGPVLTTVGFVDDNTELPREMTMQEILDAIFYGSKISISVDESVNVGETVDVTVCLHGGLKADSIILYQNDEILEQWSYEDFEESCVTIESFPITEDTEFRFEVIYSNGLKEEATATVKVVAPIFVGLLPKWKFGNTVSLKYLKELNAEDSQNNQFYTYDVEPTSISHNYSFQGKKLQHFLLAVPADCPELDLMITPSQQFDKEAFDIIDMIPFQFKLQDDKSIDIVYKLYIYKEALIRANLPVTFNFK